jgi:DNA-binding GntR family transcriptional regulator
MTYAARVTPGYLSKTDMVAALIRELIITGELTAGEQLRQRDLAQRFGVSQTPVREAMRRLESEGLVIGDTHRGFTVVAGDAGPVEENFQIRAALESLGASLAARKIDAAGISRLEDLNRRMTALAEDDPRYSELNREFHFTLYEYSRSASRIASCWRADSACVRSTRGPPCRDAHSSRISDISSGLREYS